VNNPQPETSTDARTTTLRRQVLLVGGVVPIVIALAGTLAMISWMAELPDPVAVHWSGDGPDGYGPAWPLVLTPLGIVLVFSVFAVLTAWKPTANRMLTASQKFVLATGTWLSTMLTLGISGSVAIQRGLEDASQAGDVSLFILGGAVAGLVLAVPAWFLLPAVDPSPHTVIEPEPLELHPSERVSWSRTVMIAPAALTVALVALCAAVVAVIVTALNAPQGVGFAVSSLVVVSLLLLGTSYWRVSADRRGLTVRSGLGWPRVSIPIDELQAAHVITVNPAADFGGWGWRQDLAGRSGIIMRGGQAIQVTRASGKKFVVTVDDAETGAGVLAALLR
jgi:hypothetical protein